MKKKLVSVIIPSYKSRGGIIASVDSVLCQTYNNIEVIVIDDNDPESEFRKQTEKYMEKYLSDSRVKYIKHEKNKNGAVARNTGIKASNGEYIAFLDDDDTFRPLKLEIQVDYLNSNPSKDGVYSSLAIDGNPIVIIPYQGNALIPLLTERTRMFTSTLLFRRQSLFDIKGFTETFGRHQDFDLLIKFFWAGFKIGFVDDVLTDYYNVGTNRLRGKLLEDLKEQYLSQFSEVIDSLEEQKPGSKKKIIVNNFASVFVSYIAMKEYKLACKLFFKYFTYSPLDFISYLMFFVKNKVLNFLYRIKIW